MNLFRSEEHAKRWSGYDAAMGAALKPVAEWADIFSNPFFRQRGRPDYISWTRTEEGGAYKRKAPHLSKSKYMPPINRNVPEAARLRVADHVLGLMDTLEAARR